MSEQEVAGLLGDDGEGLRNLISCEPEVSTIQKQVEKYVADVEELSKSNAESKRALVQVLEKYEAKVAEFQSLQEQSSGLETEVKQTTISKKQISDLVNQKIKAKELSTKDLEKQFYKEKSLTGKDFVSQFMKERKDYHKYQIYKQKVNAQ